MTDDSMFERRWLLWNNERGAWWRNGGGYTLDITEAQRFTESVARVSADQGAHEDGTLCDVPVKAPTGRVPLPTGLDTGQLREFALAIDRQAGSGLGTVIELMLIRRALTITVRGIPEPVDPVGEVIT